MNYLLSLVIFLPLLAAFVIAGLTVVPLPKPQRDNLVRVIALAASGITCLLGIYLWMAYDGAAVGKLQYVERATWIPSLGIE